MILHVLKIMVGWLMLSAIPVYTIIDMIETAENVWSDSCVAAMTDRDIKAKGSDV